ncbi:MFS transporter [Candidatus Parcubacteria bacterium]|nr:MFS transporter [Candidatus Parcubacteria bacterium]
MFSLVGKIKNQFAGIEPVAKKLSFSHFLLMFGYKLFSLYFPLFLVWKGLSFAQVGYTYLFIYLPLAFFSPISGFLCSRFNEKVLMIIGIFGYFLYSLGMILNVNLFFFYLFQVLLGISASLFFVSSKSLFVSLTKKANESFAWFYSMPIYAEVLAPAIGAFLIWQFGFVGVFIFSFAIHFFNIFYSSKSLKKIKNLSRVQPENIEKIKNDYSSIFKKIKEKEVALLLGLVFLTIILTGFYRAFFVLYLKNQLFWSQNKILLFISLVSIVFVVISWKLIKIIGAQKSRTNVLQGSIIKSLVTIVLGIGFKFLTFNSLFIVKIVERMSYLMINSGRSGYFARKFKKFPEEIGAIDTLFIPLGVAVGSLLGGFLLNFFSFAVIFQWFGIFLLICTILVWFLIRRE